MSNCNRREQQQPSTSSEQISTGKWQTCHGQSQTTGCEVGTSLSWRKKQFTEVRKIFTSNERKCLELKSKPMELEAVDYNNDNANDTDGYSNKPRRLEVKSTEGMETPSSRKCRGFGEVNWGRGRQS